MILRTWRGRTRIEDRDRYHAYLQRTGITAFKATPGNRGAFVVQREQDGLAEFVVLSLWDSMEAVERFAGPSPGRAVYYPEDDEFLVDKDDHVDHFEVLEAPDFV